MADDIHQLGGLLAHEIKDADRQILELVKDNANRIAALEKHIWANGRPSLEDRLRAYTEQQVDHAKKNVLQQLVNSDGKFTIQMDNSNLRSEDRLKQTMDAAKENGRKLDEARTRMDERDEDWNARLNKMVWTVALGAVGLVVTLILQIIGMHKA